MSLEKIYHEPNYFPASNTLSSWLTPPAIQFLFMFGLGVIILGALVPAYSWLLWVSVPMLIWGFLNDFEPWPPEWFFTNHHPGKGKFYVLLMWYIRNPFQNIGRYGLGVSTLTYTVIGPKPAYETTAYEWALYQGLNASEYSAWKWSILWFGWKFPIPFPYISYEDTKWKFYAGWQHNGFCGIKLHPKG